MADEASRDSGLSSTVSALGTGPARKLGVEEIERLARRFDVDGYVVIPGLVNPAPLAELDQRLCDAYPREKEQGTLFEGVASSAATSTVSPASSHGSFGTTSSTPASSTSCAGPPRHRRLGAGDDELQPARAASPSTTTSTASTLKEFLICNIAVVDTDLVNGAIDVLPGTHREFYKFWRYALQRKYRLTTRLPLPQGDVVVCASRRCGTAACPTGATPRGR